MSEFGSHIDFENYSFNPEAKRQVLLIHGFSSSTGELLPLAEFLADKGFGVLAENLPGHASSIAQCNRQKWQDWTEDLELRVGEWMAFEKEIFIAGVSMGAVLALHLATVFPVHAVVCGAPVISFRKEWQLRWLNGWSSHFYRKRPKCEADEIYGYTHFPLRALQQYYRFTRVLLPQLKKVSAPTLCLSAKRDNLSRKRNSRIIQNGIRSETFLLREYSNASHNIFSAHPDSAQVFADVTQFLGEHSA